MKPVQFTDGTWGLLRDNGWGVHDEDNRPLKFETEEAAQAEADERTKGHPMTDKTIEAVARAIAECTFEKICSFAEASRKNGYPVSDPLPPNWRAYTEETEAAITAHLKALEAEGMVVVPRDPRCDCVTAIEATEFFRAMISAHKEQ